MCFFNGNVIILNCYIKKLLIILKKNNTRKWERANLLGNFNLIVPNKSFDALLYPSAYSRGRLAH